MFLKENSIVQCSDNLTFLSPDRFLSSRTWCVRCPSPDLHWVIFVTSFSPLVLCYCHLLILIVHHEVAIRTLLTRRLHRGFCLLFLSASILLSLSSVLVPACICLTTFHSTSLTFSVCLSHSALRHLWVSFSFCPNYHFLYYHSNQMFIHRFELLTFFLYFFFLPPLQPTYWLFSSVWMI